MKRVIDPGIPATIEYTCDGCGLPVMVSPHNPFAREYCLAIEASFGYLSPRDGYNYKLALCGDCAMKVTKAIERDLNIVIYPGYGMSDPFFQDVAQGDTDE